MASFQALSPKTLLRDLAAGLVVFLVALPLCLGVPLACSLKDLAFAGVLAGVIGGILVGALSGSQTSACRSESSGGISGRASRSF